MTDFSGRETLVRITGGGPAASEAVASDETLVRITGGGPAATEAFT